MVCQVVLCKQLSKSYEQKMGLKAVFTPEMRCELGESLQK